MTEDRFLQAQREIHAQFKTGEISERMRDDALRMVDADEAQARMLAALPEFPQYGFYVKTGLAGYGPDLDETDMPYTSWEDVASAVADEFGSCADFAFEGADNVATQAEEYDYAATAEYKAAENRGRSFEDYASYVNHLETYRDAWHAFKLSEDLRMRAADFSNLAKTEDVAPLYAGRPELRHARIWDLISSSFPYDVSDNTRLYVWQCDEYPGTEDD